MSKTFSADGGAMPVASLTRRLFLRNAVAAGAVGAAVAIEAEAATPDPEEYPALIQAWKELRFLEKDYRDARTAAGLPFKADSREDPRTMDDAFQNALSSVIRKKARTLYGVRLKADAMAFYFEFIGIDPGRHGFLGLSFWLACDVLEHTEHLDRGGAA